MELLVATKEDTKAVLKLLQPYYKQCIMGFNPPVVYFSAMDKGELFVVKEEGVVIGFLLVKLRKRSDKFKIQQIAKVEGTQVKGIGDLLFQKAKDMAVENGYSGIELRVKKKNERAQKFYMKHGLKIVGEIEESYMMEMPINGINKTGMRKLPRKEI